MRSPVLLEVCVDSAISALAAQEGGASRVELCSALEVGGVTPGRGLLESVRNRITIGLHVLIRPRGGDFLYDEDELQAMKADIGQAKALGAEGVVFGILKSDGTVDVERTGVLVSLARPMSVTFHRAFDLALDPKQALSDIIGLGIDRILTSGQAASAQKGMGLIAELVRLSTDSVVIMPGGGINEKNAGRIASITGAREIHSSASVVNDSPMIFRNLSVSLESDGYARRRTDAATVRAIIVAANGGTK